VGRPVSEALAAPFADLVAEQLREEGYTEPRIAQILSCYVEECALYATPRTPEDALTTLDFARLRDFANAKREATRG
jgi:hypothetical protein